MRLSLLFKGRWMQVGATDINAWQAFSIEASQGWILLADRVSVLRAVRSDERIREPKKGTKNSKEQKGAKRDDFR